MRAKDKSGTEEKIFTRAGEIREVLQNLFADGTWLVKIESNDVSEAIYLDETNIYDNEFNIIRVRCRESFAETLVSKKQVCNYYTQYKYMPLKIPF